MHPVLCGSIRVFLRTKRRRVKISEDVLLLKSERVVERDNEDVPLMRSSIR